MHFQNRNHTLRARRCATCFDERFGRGIQFCSHHSTLFFESGKYSAARVKAAHLIILLVMNLAWAAVYSVYKIVGADVPSGSIVTLRFGMAAICFLTAWPWLPGPTPRGW